MAIAEQVGPPEVYAGLGFDRKRGVAGNDGRAQGARVSPGSQLGGDAPGDHVGDFPGGILLHRFLFGAVEAGQLFDGPGNEGKRE